MGNATNIYELKRNLYRLTLVVQYSMSVDEFRFNNIESALSDESFDFTIF